MSLQSEDAASDILEPFELGYWLRVKVRELSGSDGVQDEFDKILEAQVL